MKFTTRKIISLILVLVMSLSLLSTAAFAASEQSTVEAQITANVNHDDLFISENVAREMAKLFLRDALSFPDICWDENTRVVNSVTMYDAEIDGEITAYTFELTSGYIVVSAYLDAPNTILEWSDTAAPVYKNFDNMNERIVYLGNLSYYQDNGDDTLVSVDGNEIKRDETVNAIAETSKLSNVPAALLREIETKKNSAQLMGEITDPFTHANSNYQGPFVAIPGDWCNKWENYMSFELMTSYNTVDGKTYKDHCGPTAILNIVLSCKNRYGMPDIANTPKAQLFKQILTYGLNMQFYSPGIGTIRLTANAYIKNVMAAFGRSVNVNGRHNIDYNNVKAKLNDNDLLYLSLDNHETYGDHALIGYGYCRIQSQTTEWYKSYIKVADGWSSRPRYIDMASAANSKFWSVDF